MRGRRRTVAARRGGLAALLTMMLAAGPAWAATYRAIAVDAAVLYDGPSEKARKVFVAPRAMPVEVLSGLPAWTKIRDLAGDVMWVHASELGPRTHVVARALTPLRRTPATDAPAPHAVERGVLLELLGPGPTGWLRVRHDGVTGYVRNEEVWGD